MLLAISASRCRSGDSGEPERRARLLARPCVLWCQHATPRGHHLEGKLCSIAQCVCVCLCANAAKLGLENQGLWQGELCSSDSQGRSCKNACFWGFVSTVRRQKYTLHVGCMCALRLGRWTPLLTFHPPDVLKAAWLRPHSNVSWLASCCAT
jgi:hypothetical protein